jgi:hypothetical protein
MPKSAKPRKEYKPNSSKNSLHGSGTMTTQEIVKRSTERMDPSADWENVYSHVYGAIKSDKFRALRHGDTILFFRVQTPVASQAHIFSADPQEKLLEALREFGRSLKIAGYKKLTGIVRNASLLRLIRKANSIKFEVNDKPIRAYGDSGEVLGYNLEIGIK